MKKNHKLSKLLGFTMQTNVKSLHYQKKSYKKEKRKLEEEKKKIKKRKLEEEKKKIIQLEKKLNNDVKNKKAVLKRKGGGGRRYNNQAETDALIRLENNFQCLCGMGKHFPILLHKNFDGKQKFYMTYMGKDLRYLDHEIHIPNITKQIDCIVYNLRKSNIVHFDIQSKNICVDNNGKLSLIDFEHILIDGKNLIDGKYPHGINRQIKARYSEYDYDTEDLERYYEKVRTLIYQPVILTNNVSY